MRIRKPSLTGVSAYGLMLAKPASDRWCLKSVASIERKIGIHHRLDLPTPAINE
jgi:hypothetical protein